MIPSPALEGDGDRSSETAIGSCSAGLGEATLVDRTIPTQVRF